jgi:hypothetical protein
MGRSATEGSMHASWVIKTLLVLIAIVAAMFFSLPSYTHSPLDTRFDSIAVGMSRSDIERLLGRPVDPADATVRQIVGVRHPDPFAGHVWWHDRGYRCLSIEFTPDDRVRQAELFASGSFATRKLVKSGNAKPGAAADGGAR